MQADLEKMETSQRSEYRNTHSIRHGKGKSNAQGKDEKFVGQRDFRKMTCYVRKGEILLLSTLMMATYEA